MPTRGEAATAGKREEGEGSGEEGRQLTLVADGVVPEGAGALVLGALQVALPGGGGVLELLVAVIAVVFPQRHPLGRSPLSAHFPFFKPCFCSCSNKFYEKFCK